MSYAVKMSFRERQEAYRAYLLTDHWKELRGEKLRLCPMCEVCGMNEATEAHHLVYRDLYDCTIKDLVSACFPCHKRVHKSRSHPLNPARFREQGGRRSTEVKAVQRRWGRRYVSQNVQIDRIRRRLLAGQP